MPEALGVMAFPPGVVKAEPLRLRPLPLRALTLATDL